MGRDLPRTYRFGDFCLDIANRQLRQNGVDIFLRPKTFDTLLCLVEHHGRLVKKGELMDTVWAETNITEAVLTHCVAEARKALHDDPLSPRYIKTIPRVGYKFIAEFGEPTDETAKRRSFKTKYWMAAAALIIAAGVWAYLRFFPLQQALPEPTIVPVPTVRTGERGDYTLSPDGAWFAFCWNGDKKDNWDIYLKEVDGSGFNRVTTDPARDGWPSWSPDGRRLAFIRMSGDRGVLKVVSAMGGIERELTEVKTGTRTAWSSDGKTIAFSDKQSPDSPWAIWSIGVDSPEKSQLTSPPPGGPGDSEPAYSPDGRYLAFCRGYVPTSRLYVMPLPRGTPRPLTIAGWARYPSWTADSREVIFYIPIALFRVSLEGGEPRRIPSRGQYFSGLSVGRNRLLYEALAGKSDLWRLDLTGKIPLQTPSVPFSSRSSSGVESALKVSPDGNGIAFVSDQSGTIEIWVSDAKGTETVQLSHLKAENSGSPSWSPDGKRIAFDSTKHGNSDLFLVRAEGGPVQRITTESTDEVVPLWSKDGSSIYFGSNRSGEWQIWRMPSNGGQPVQITRKGGCFAVDLVDGYIYYSLYLKRGLWRVPESGGPETLVSDAVDWGYCDVTRQGIYFMKGPAGPICFYDFSSGRVSELARAHSDPSFKVAPGISLFPDGKSLLYSGAFVISDCMLIENFR